MITPPERSEARDAAIEAMLPLAGALGWTRRALAEAAGPHADLLFPGGGPDMVEAFIDLADRQMVRDAEPAIAEQRPSRRVRTLLAARFERAVTHRDAVRRAATLLAHPANAGLAARCTARTVDAIWFAAGDSSADFNWYTKRALLAAVYSSTLLYWLSGRATLDETLAFMDRRLAGVAQIGKWRARLFKSRAA